MLNGLDLFSGYGGAQDALRGLVRTVAYCEIERGAQRILLRRMRKGHISVAPIWDDVRSLRKRHIIEPVDIITGGFPCQDFSVAGNGDSLEGRSGMLFFEIVRLLSDFRPRFFFLENVPAIAVRGLDRVLMELTNVGYDCRWSIVSAAEVGACHLRKRVWILGHANGQHSDLQDAENTDSDSELIRSKPIKQQGRIDSPKFKWDGSRWHPSWSSERFAQPRVDRTGDGIGNRSHRARAMGNGWVPQTAREAFIRLIGVKQ